MYRRWCLISVLVLASGCGTAAPPSQAPQQLTIPQLEERRQDRPGDPVVGLRLGAAYSQAGRYDDAAAVLSDVTELPDAPPRAWARLGAALERLERWEAAQTAYEEYVERGGEEARAAVEPRLKYVGRQLLRARARELLAREADLTSEPPDAEAVAVMPLLVEGGPEYRPLGRGIAELLTTDLSLTDRLRVVERAQLQALLTEMKLSLGGYVQQETAVRTGRMIRAGRVVQGLVRDPSGEFALEVMVVDARAAGLEASVTRSGRLEDLFDVEAEVALGIYEELGVALTSAEIARIRESPTSNVQAYLAYSSGLTAMDQGDYRQAQQHFQQATQLDPGFQEAADVQEEAATLSTAQATAPEEVAAADETEEVEAAPVEEEAGEEEEEAEEEQGEQEEQAGQEEQTGQTEQGAGTSTSSTMEGLATSTANAGAGAATETTSATAPTGTTETGETGGTEGTGGTTGGTGSPSTRGEGVLVDRLIQWTLSRPNPWVVLWPW